MKATLLHPPQVPLDNVFFFLEFDNFDPRNNYVVKGTGINTEFNRVPEVFEVIVPVDSPPLTELIRRGILIRAMQINTQPITQGFMVEVSQFPQ